MPTLVQSPSALGRALRDARRRNRLSQSQLAEIAGVAQPTISNIERGRGGTSLGTLLLILAALKLELVLQERKSRGSVAAWQSHS
jgi:HTH-type transcriptional regulator/antitoxin HipB